MRRPALAIAISGRSASSRRGVARGPAAVVTELQHCTLQCVAAPAAVRPPPVRRRSRARSSSASRRRSTIEPAFVVDAGRARGGQSARSVSARVQDLARRDHAHGHPVPRRTSAQRPQCARRERFPAQPQLTDGQRFEHRDRAARVIEIGVGHDQRVEPTDSSARSAGTTTARPASKPAKRVPVSTSQRPAFGAQQHVRRRDHVEEPQRRRRDRGIPIGAPANRRPRPRRATRARLGLGRARAPAARSPAPRRRAPARSDRADPPADPDSRAIRAGECRARRSCARASRATRIDRRPPRPRVRAERPGPRKYGTARASATSQPAGSGAPIAAASGAVISPAASETCRDPRTRPAADARAGGPRRPRTRAGTRARTAPLDRTRAPAAPPAPARSRPPRVGRRAAPCPAAKAIAAARSAADRSHTERRSRSGRDAEGESDRARAAQRRQPARPAQREGEQRPARSRPRTPRGSLRR